MRIGHASIAETGGVYGTPGDQTGKEVCERPWYDSGWDYMAIHPDPLVRDRHAKAVEQACANPCVGYSWDNRNSLYEQARLVDMDIARITTPCNCDCSSLQNCAAVASRAPGITYGSNGWVTTNMLQPLKSAGYVIMRGDMIHSADYCVRGAIYVSSGHTVCGLDDGPKAKETLQKAGLDDTVVVIPPESPEEPAPATTWHDVSLPTLRNGDVGEAVRAAQILLKGRGFSVGWYGCDGEFGNATENAVIKFQRDRGLETDGVIGPKTWKKLICD